MVIATWSGLYLAYVGAGTLAESTQILGLYLGIIVDFVTVYYCGRAYYYFRRTGGIKGTGNTKDLAEDKIMNGVGKVAGTGAAALSAQLDKDDAKHAKEEEDNKAIADALKNTPN